MELVELDLFDPERTEGAVAGGVQLRGSGVALPAAAWTYHAALGGHGHAATITGPAGECPRDQALVVSDLALIETVDVRAVDKSDAC